MRNATFALALALAVGLAFAAPAARAMDPAETGIVVLHGKWGNPGQMAGLGAAFREAGFAVEAPEMPWSGNRLFDQGYDQSLAEIDRAADRLRAAGARRLGGAGHRGGPTAARAHAGGPRPPHAAILFAPGHFPEGRVFREKLADNIARARAMVAEGKGGDAASFTSLNDGDRSRQVQVRAADYLSFYAPDGPAAMAANAARLPAGIPVLWVAPRRDPLSNVFASLVQPRVPAAVRLERLDIDGGHLDAPDSGRGDAVSWVKAQP